jgi:ATPase components of ABC transporters with duplicated ATPase domains
MSIILKNLSYLHPDREILFKQLNLTLPSGQKAALVGHNGSGKSTLLNIVRGYSKPSEGEVVYSDKPYFVHQHFGQYNQLTIAQALEIEEKLDALHAILEGDASIENFAILNEDWTIEERAKEALAVWGLKQFHLSQPLDSLSGGEKTKVFLAGINIHQPDVILMDEPTNHLDRDSRRQLYHFIDNCKATLLVVSHDRTLLNRLDLIFELNKEEIKAYGGNYEFYREMKEKEENALLNQLEEKEKSLRLAKKTARETIERQQKHSVRGEKLSAKKGIPKIMMGAMKDKSEKSTTRLAGVHDEKMSAMTEDLSNMRKRLSQQKDLKLDIESAKLHSGKILVDVRDMTFGYDEKSLWVPQTFQVLSGERIAISGGNGSGKTTLVKLITGELQPKSGSIYRAEQEYIYIDQEYSLLNNSLTLYEQAEEFNDQHKPEHELKIILNRFLFPRTTFNKRVAQLSGGEKMRLLLCCLQVKNNMPDMIILDEPTNNLDIRSLEILTSTIRSYKGTVIVISHDEYFINEINVNNFLLLLSK